MEQSDKEIKNIYEKDNAHNTESGVLAYLHDLVGLIITMLLIFSLCFRIVIVSGPSMEETFVDGDWLLLFSNTFCSEFKQGDVVVASKKAYDNGTPIIKRVIATEGQTVDIDFDKGIVTVDGVSLVEPYTKTLTNLYEGESFPQVVKAGCVFVMGDNRNESKDSRSPEIGQIDKREILGKAFILVFPGTEGGHRQLDLKRIGVIS